MLFHGYAGAVIQPLALSSLIHTTVLLLQVIVGCPLRRQRIKPEAKLTHVLSSIRPKDFVLEPLLDPRDSLPGGRVAYRLVLSYSFSVSEGGKHKAAVPLTNGWVQRGEWEGLECEADLG
jgi:hypothetical protein